MLLYEQIFFGIGCLTAALLAPKTIGYIVSVLTRPCRRMGLKAEENDYAIVTGGTDGIGLEYARQLAEKGYNLLLLSRTQSKLEKVRDEIQDCFHVDVEILAVDFTRIDIYEAILDKINSIDGRISVLVNNVGMVRTVPYEFTEYKDDINIKTLLCNTVPVTRMCELVLPIMKNQHHGIVINISSAIALIPFPYYTLYGATKAFVSSFTTMLAQEYKNYGIIFQDVTPNQVSTTLVRNVDSSTVSVDAESFVRYALNSVGAEFHTSAHPRHKFFNTIMQIDILPEFMTNALRLLMMKKIRSDALAKQKDSH